MPHYVCTGGCGGVSDTPKACDAKGCLKEGQPLTECNCTDGQHAEAYQNPNTTAPSAPT